jgi:hypothetical protein
MRRLRLVFWTLVVCATAAAAAAAASVSTADAQRLANAVRANGARNTVLRLRRDRREWSRVVESVASGKREWIDLAVSLKPGSDIAQGRELQNAMFGALSRNPSYVLLRAQPDFPLAVLCLGPADSLSSRLVAMAELDQAQKALQAVQSKSLLAKRELCLATIEEGRVNVQRSRD